MTPYNHSTYYYNELLNSGRQVGDSFYAYVGGGSSTNSVDFWRCFVFLAPSDDSSSFCRLRWAIRSSGFLYGLQVHLCGVQQLLPAVRDWSPHKWIARGSFARPLRLASLLWFLRTRLFACRALATAAVGASPGWNLILGWNVRQGTDMYSEVSKKRIVSRFCQNPSKV